MIISIFNRMCFDSMFCRGAFGDSYIPQVTPL